MDLLKQIGVHVVICVRFELQLFQQAGGTNGFVTGQRVMQWQVDVLAALVAARDVPNLTNNHANESHTT